MGSRFRRAKSDFRLADRILRAVGSHPKTIADSRSWCLGCKGPGPYWLAGPNGVGSHQSVCITKPMPLALKATVYVNCAGDAVVGSNNIRPEQNVRIPDWKYHLEGRNNGTEDAEVRLFLLWPKRQADADDLKDVSGVAPALSTVLDHVENWSATIGAAMVPNPLFVERPRPQGVGMGATQQTSLQWEWSPAYDVQWSEMCRVKLVKRRVLKPGDQLRFSLRRKGLTLNRNTLGLGAQPGQFVGEATTPALQRGEPVLVVCVRGTLTHGKDTSDLVTAAAAASNPSVAVTYGDFMTEWLERWDVSYRQTFNQSFGVNPSLLARGYVTGPMGEKLATAQVREQIQPDAPAQVVADL